MSDLPFRPALNNLKTYVPGKNPEESGVIKLASNENPLGPSRLALGAMRKALTQVHLYPDGNAFYLKQKLAAKLGVTPASLILAAADSAARFPAPTALSRSSMGPATSTRFAPPTTT